MVHAGNKYLVEFPDVTLHRCQQVGLLHLTVDDQSDHLEGDGHLCK